MWGEGALVPGDESVSAGIGTSQERKVLRNSSPSEAKPIGTGFTDHQVDERRVVPAACCTRQDQSLPTLALVESADVQAQRPFIKSLRALAA